MLFCDIVDSTGLAERLGPEAMHELIGWFMDTALAEVRRYDGTAPQFAGDGFLALFGAPATHEDHVRRALLAALAIRDAIGASHGVPGGRQSPKLQLRIGIHTGLVVFGSVGGNLRMDPTVIGDAANIGARLQAAAEPGTILISDDTRRLAEGYAHVEPIGALTLKGKDEPINAYRLIGFSHRRSSPAPRPFVDRTDELARLHNLVRPVAEGHGRAAGVVGEAGIGKSRIIAELRTHLGRSINWVEGRCLSYGTAVPYLLVLDLLRGVCGIEESDAPEIIAEKLRTKLAQFGMVPEEDAPVLLLLLGIEAHGGAPPLANPEALKARTFEILRQLVLRSSRHRSLATVLEDLHWIDKISEEFVASLVEAIADAPILLITTYRPGYRPPWADKPFAAQISLQPLSRADSHELVRAVPGRRDAPTTEAIVAKADGNPLFLEELSLDAGEARDARAAGSVPNTIQDVVMARIDRLPAETKRLLQTAAVIGREFSLRLLRAVWRGAGAIEPHLSELTRLEFIHERPDPVQPGYAFRHALTQETAYMSLLERHRRAMHAHVGRAIENFYEGRAEEVAERLALHFGRSDDAEKAVDYAILAAEKSQRRWANSEALAYFEDALRRLDAMPDTAPNRQRRIDAVLKQAEVKYALGQYAEQIQALDAIRGIVDESEDPHRRAAWHYWMGFLHATSGGRPETAIEHCREAMRIASTSGLEDIDAFAASSLAQVYIIAGRPRDAIAAGERALASFETRGNRWWAGRTLWHLTGAANYLGDWEASLDYCRRGLAHGIALQDLRLKAVGWSRMGAAYIQQGEVSRGIECCDEALALNPIPRDAAWAKMVRGYGYIKAGRINEGITELSEALAWFESARMRVTQVIGTTWLAEGHLRRGDSARARPLIDHLLATTRESGYLQFEGRACWLMAECLAIEAPGAAEDHAEAAMRIFLQVGARNDLARAMLTRAALRRQAGDRETDRQLLDEAYAIFELLGTRYERAAVGATFAHLRDAPARG
ncbi:MAG TPA: AAA family ATPase [Stellaceae bacterium]|nr:AAA family ATPase [Stellaceae bacterium]